MVGTLTRGVETLLKRSGVEVIRATANWRRAARCRWARTSYEARNIFIATGSKPAVPPIPGIDSEGVLDSTSVFGVTSMPERLIIIGGGYIGLEFASFFSAVGTKVTVSGNAAANRRRMRPRDFHPAAAGDGQGRGRVQNRPAR